MKKKDKKLLDETMMILSERLKLISKKTISDIKNLDIHDENGDYYFYIGGNEDKHMFECWFSHDRNQPVLRCRSGDENYRNLRLRFPKKEIKKRSDRETMVFWLVEHIFSDSPNRPPLLKEEELADYFIENIGFSIPFSKCFRVMRTSDNKPYTGAKGEKPFVGYNSRYTNQTNHGDTYMENVNLQRVVKEKCKELGFTLKPEQNGIIKLEFEVDPETKEMKCKSPLPPAMEKELNEYNDLVNNRILLN